MHPFDVFPALSLLLFVVPQRTVEENPDFATQAVISLSVFAVLANSLFSFGLTIAGNREKPWDPYLRTLPAPGIARVLAPSRHAREIVVRDSCGPGRTGGARCALSALPSQNPATPLKK